MSASHSIYRNVFQLPPGHIVVIDTIGRISEHRYWNLREITAAGVASPLDLTEADASTCSTPLLRDAARRRMLASATGFDVFQGASHLISTHCQLS